MKLEFNFSKLISIPDMFSGEKFETLKRTILSVMIGQKDEVFQAESDPDGNKWAPLSEKTLSGRKKGKKKNAAKILQDTGMLRNSLTSSNAPYEIQSTEGSDVTLGTNVPYAATHQFGHTFTVQSLHETADGMSLMGVNVHIPARPFIGFGQKDNEEVTETVEGFINKAGA
jgi:phage virion morphogenesis protein